MRCILSAAAALALIALPDVALAYVGPGAGLSLLGALWALVVAVVTALAFILLWPLRRMLRRRREGAVQDPSEAPADTVEPQARTSAEEEHTLQSSRGS